MRRLSLQRIIRFVRRAGFWAIPKTAALKVWRRLFADRHFVFSLAADSFHVRQTVCDLKIRKYRKLGELPTPHMQQLLAEEGAGLLEQMKQEFSNYGILWVAVLDEHVVAYQWSRRASNIQRWFVPLQADDVVIFATVTFPQWRGRGIGPAMMQHIIAEELAGGGHAYVDCKVWNKPAIRGISKAGFACLGQMRPL